MSRRILSAWAGAALVMGGCRCTVPEPSAETTAPPARVRNIWVHGAGVLVDEDKPKPDRPIIQGTVPTDPDAPRHAIPFVPGQKAE